jgi:hypothetical protein
MHRISVITFCEVFPSSVSARRSEIRSAAAINALRTY